MSGASPSSPWRASCSSPSGATSPRASSPRAPCSRPLKRGINEVSARPDQPRRGWVGGAAWPAGNSVADAQEWTRLPSPILRACSVMVLPPRRQSDVRFRGIVAAANRNHRLGPDPTDLPILRPTPRVWRRARSPQGQAAARRPCGPTLPRSPRGAPLSSGPGRRELHQAEQRGQS